MDADGKKSVIIDCDVGVDDALALILAFNSPEIEIKAVTGVNGNVPLDQVFANIKKILSLIQPNSPPLIAKGADRPLKGNPVYAHSVHGSSGLGGAKIEVPEGEKWWRIFPGPADELIAEIASQDPHNITLIAVGPLTNLALGMKKNPQRMKKMRDIVIMGGAVRTKGNITPYAEFNIFVDPLAAQMVFESGIPITLVPLDVTHQVFLTPSLMEERVRPIDNRLSSFVVAATAYDLMENRFPRGASKFYLHDPLAVGVVLDPHLMEKEKIRLTVETAEGETYGRVSEENEDQPAIDVCLTVNSSKFLDLFFSRLKA